MIRLQNEQVSIGFDEQNGCLQSLCIRSSGKEFIKPDAGRRNPFLVWKKFKKPYAFIDNRTPPDPADLAGTCLSPAGKMTAATVAVSDGRADLTYDLGGGLTARVTVTLDGCRSRWSFMLQNTGRRTQTVLPVFPAISGLQIDQRRGRMLAMNQSGFIDKIWAYSGGPYGNSAACSAQFGCLFEDSQCLGYLIEDAAFGPKDIRTVIPNLQVRYFPPRELAPGQKIVLPDTVLLLYEGDWRQTATAYGDWFRQTLRPEPTPDWVYEIDAYSGAWAEKKGKPNQEGGNLSTGMDTFEDLPDRYRQFPLECFEYAFYCEQSSRDANGPDGKPLGPQPRRHTDGWNSVRQDLGGAASLRRGVEKLHEMGRRITLYIEGLIVPRDSELFEHIPAARDWVLHNPDGTNTGPYTQAEWVHMCPGCIEWQDHVAAMAARLVRETDVDGIRGDGEELVFGTRPAIRRSDEADLRDGLVLLRARRMPAEIRLPLDYAPARASLYDLEQQTLTALDYRYDGTTVRFDTDASWFMAILEKTAGPAPVIMTGPESVQAGRPVRLSITSPALAEPVQATVTVAGLPGFKAKPVLAPGRLSVRIPAGTQPGQAIIRLDGDGIRPVVKVVEITAP